MMLRFGDAITVELEPDLHDWLRERAEKHGVSVEEEALSLLRAAYEAALAAKRQGEQAP